MASEHRDLRKVLEITRRMAAVVELDELLSLIIERSVELLDAERATLFLHDEAAGELVSRIATGAGEIRFPAERGIAGATLREGRTINIPDAYADERFNPEVDRATGFATRSILSLPLTDQEGRAVGVLQALNRRGGPFTSDDESLGETLAAQAGVSLQRARLIAHYLQKQRMERSMQIAHDIQQGLLPHAAPRIDGFDVAGFSRPADAAGGDTYDWQELPDGRWLFAVADASGHGIGPALVIPETRAMIRAICCAACDVETVLARANELLAADLDGRFVTCFLGVLDAGCAPGAAQAGELTYASAGHGPLLFYTRDRDAFDEVAATGIPLGIAPTAEFAAQRRVLSPGDLVAVTSDGFFEARAPGGEEFGIRRMCEQLRRDRDRPAAQMIANLRAAVDDFTDGAPQGDDLTAVVIRRT
ncbi:MAG: PP2C family protein-serine/threonine phosphatase [Planctomycetota bacterium]